MDNNQNLQNQYPGEDEAMRSYRLQIWKDRFYRFFYNIWPAVRGVLTFVFYYSFKIFRGFIKTAMEQFHQN